MARKTFLQLSLYTRQLASFTGEEYRSHRGKQPSFRQRLGNDYERWRFQDSGMD